MVIKFFNGKFSSLATVHLLSSHMLPGAAIVDGTDIQHFPNLRKFYYTAQETTLSTSPEHRLEANAIGK